MNFLKRQASLCCHTIENACLAYPSLRGATLHSDRGSQYTGERYRRALSTHGMIQSLKTSIRVKTRQEQLTEAGFYTGGDISCGYRLVKGGRLNKKSRSVLDLEIDADEAEIVRLIFHNYVDAGYGSQRICRFLHENGIKRRDGEGFPNTSLNRIIKNVAYTGIIKKWR